MNHRRAFTLVELLILLSASSVLMVLAVGLVHQSLSASSLAKGRTDHQRTLVRLGDQFRSDVHSSVTVELRTPTRLRLRSSKGPLIEYRIDDSRCQREESSGERRTRVESYRLNDDSQLAFSQLTGPERVTLVVNRQSRVPREPALLDAHVVAVVGRRVTLPGKTEANPE